MAHHNNRSAVLDLRRPRLPFRSLPVPLPLRRAKTHNSEHDSSLDPASLPDNAERHHRHAHQPVTPSLTTAARYCCWRRIPRSGLDDRILDVFIWGQ